MSRKFWCRLAILVMVAVGFWTLRTFDQALGLHWAASRFAVWTQAGMWLVAGVAMAGLGRPSLRGSSWGALAIAAVGTGFNHWWVARMGGAILVGPPLAQMLHAAVWVSAGIGGLNLWRATVRWTPKSRAASATIGSARVAAQRLGERVPAVL